MIILLKALVHQDSQKNSLSHDEITSLELDEAGGVWIGTFVKGLNRFNNSHGQFNHVHRENYSISNDVILGLLKDDEHILIGSYGGGLTVFNKEKDHYRYYQKNNNSLISDVVTAIIPDNGFYWLGTIGGGFSQFNLKGNKFIHYQNDPDDVNSVSHDNILTLLKDSKGFLWVGTWGGGLNKFNPQTGTFTRFFVDENSASSLSDNSVWALYEDKQGHIWVGTENGGLNKFNSKTNTFKHFLHYKNKNSLSHNSVLSIHESSDGAMWIGTKGGLNKFDPITETFVHYREKDGLANDSVVGILEDKAGFLWLSTNKGLSRFNTKTEAFKNYDVKDGLQNNEFNALAYHQSKNGEMFFGGVNGYNHFYPENIQDDKNLPQVVLTNFLLLNKPVEIQTAPGSDIHTNTFTLPAAINELEELVLSYHEKVIAFEFAALHFAEPMNNQYAYKLEGFDDEWIYTDAKNRRATYTNIPAGSYTFKIKASNGDGYWNEAGKTLNIKVLPPLWKTWWAYTLYVIAVLGCIFFFIYRQHIKHLQEQAINIRLTRVDKLKDEFLANTSHELRTPLNGIIGLAESLIDGVAGKLPDKATHDLSMVVSSGHRLSNLINDILDFSKLKNHGLTIQTKPVDLYSMVNVVIALSKPTIKNKTLRLVNEVPEDFVLVIADEDRLQQILFNLIGNAIKFTEQGAVNISAKTIGKRVCIRVEDTGVGIEASELKDIFDSFKQVEQTEHKSDSGTGLGLAVTKQLVELHGGTIEVTSTPMPHDNHGSCFSFFLDVADTGNIDAISARQTTVDTTELTLSSLQSVGDEIDYFSHVKNIEPDTALVTPEQETFKILIVDDDPINRQVLANHLLPKGYQLTEAVGGQQALNIIENERDNRAAGQRPFDLILLDVMMPKVSGYQVCQRVRELFSVHELPVIFLTAKNQVADLVESFSAGGNDYLTKPISKHELLSRVETHLKLLDINRNLEHQVKERTLELEHAMQAKGDFLAKMSHEIRTPMNAIIGLSHLTLKTELDTNQRDLLEKTQDASHALLDLINDVLDFSKIEAGKMGVECISMDMNTLLRKTNNICALRAHAKELELVIQLHSDVPSNIKSDPIRLQQILVNLVGNAIKFTEKGHIHIEVKLADEKTLATIAETAATQAIYNGNIDTSNIQALEFSVKDTGIGISATAVEHLFQSFAQADSSITRKYGGTGLGLSICKELTGLMGGDIRVESKQGEGSKFIFTVAFESVVEEKPAYENVELIDQLKVLAVDDNPICLDIIQGALGDFECDVSVVDNAVSALSLLKEQKQAGTPFDIVITDWKMPHIDGIEFAKIINEESDYYDVKAVLMVTAFDKNKVIPMAQSVGIDGFIEKPVTPTLLLDSMLNVLHLSSQEGIQDVEDMLAIDYSHKHVLLVEDNELNQQVVMGLLEDTQINIDIASNGQIALDKLANKMYDLVFMDVQMPVMDGITATKAIRAQSQFDKLPIVAMTAHVVPEELKKCEDAGMNEYFTKPIDPDLLGELLAKWLSVANEDEHVVIDTVEPISAVESSAVMQDVADEFIQKIMQLKALDATKALQNMGGREETYKKVLIGFYQSSSDTIKKIEAQYGGSLFEELYMTMHSLKANAAYIGAYGLSTLASELELLVNTINTSADKTPSPEVKVLVDEVCSELNKVLLACAPIIKDYLDSLHFNLELSSLQKISSDMLRLLRQEDAEVEDLLPEFIQLTRNTEFEDDVNNIVDFIEDIEYTKAIANVSTLMEKLT